MLEGVICDTIRSSLGAEKRRGEVGFGGEERLGRKKGGNKKRCGGYGRLNRTVGRVGEGGVELDAWCRGIVGTGEGGTASLGTRVSNCVRTLKPSFLKNFGLTVECDTLRKMGLYSIVLLGGKLINLLNCFRNVFFKI